MNNNINFSLARRLGLAVRVGRHHDAALFDRHARQQPGGITVLRDAGDAETGAELRGAAQAKRDPGDGQRGGAGGPDVSREGVQRDLLPIVEGSTVQTKYGMVRTDHVLFIAAGAFHVSKPSDLIPELQGRFPIRVELLPLTESDFVRIMTEPDHALTKQYAALVASDGSSLTFAPDGIAELARVATICNSRMENIGARRLHTVMTTLLEELLYGLPESGSEGIVVDAAMVRMRLEHVSQDEDLRRYIL
mgnify:CR=1 FL=1